MQSTLSQTSNEISPTEQFSPVAPTQPVKPIKSKLDIFVDPVLEASSKLSRELHDAELKYSLVDLVTQHLKTTQDEIHIACSMDKPITLVLTADGFRIRRPRPLHSEIARASLTVLAAIRQYANGDYSHSGHKKAVEQLIRPTAANLYSFNTSFKEAIRIVHEYANENVFNLSSDIAA